MFYTESNLEESMSGNEVAINDVQQYLRRDCLEIVGISRVQRPLIIIAQNAIVFRDIYLQCSVFQCLES